MVGDSWARLVMIKGIAETNLELMEISTEQLHAMREKLDPRKVP